MRHPLDVRRLTAALPKAAGWAPPVVLAEAGSTNAEALRRGVLWQPVLTEHQSAGRGRLGRTWVDVPRAGLAMSVLVPRVDPAGWLPLLTGLAVRDAIVALGVAADLKWPNDVLLPADGDRKVCGVLCELDPRRDLVVVGIGVNVDHAREELPVPTATSLCLAGAPDAALDRTGLAAAMLTRLRELHAGAAAGGQRMDQARDAYRGACTTLGRTAAVHLPGDEVVTDVAIGVDDSGALRLQNRSASVSAGDVHHVRPAPPGH